MRMLEQARETIAKYNMLSEGDRVIAGVSGGADSVALLHFLASIKAGLSLGITAAHLNHKLRGGESERDESFVKSLCEKLGVECITESADVKKLSADSGLSLEEAGRKARYAFFSRAALEKNAKIATAHTLNDSVETALLNFARGTALRGISGIPPVRGDIIRPLIECERAQIEEYCGQNGLSYVSDSSNLSDEFARNRIRHHVTPALSTINPSFFKTAAHVVESLRADADYLDEAAARACAGIEIADGRLARAAYLGFPRPIRFRILLLLLSRHGIFADYQRLARLDGIVEAGSGAEQLSASLYFKSGGGWFELLEPAGAEPYFCVPVDVGEGFETLEINVFSEKKLRLMNTDYEHCKESIKYAGNSLKNALDCDKIDRIVKLRQKIPGDAIKFPGRGCTKTLKKLFQESGIPALERGRILVLSDSNGPVWVERYGVAERAAVSAETRRILILDVQNGGESHD